MSTGEKKTKVLITEDEINAKVRELGQTITEDFAGSRLLVVSILRGGFVFTADLVRYIDLPVRIEFLSASMYEHSTENTGKLTVMDFTPEDLSDYDVLVVDDITDTALTMKGVLEHLAAKKPRTLKSCVLLDKPSRRRTEFDADYVGFEIPNVFIAGYGLNYGDHYRNNRNIVVFED